MTKAETALIADLTALLGAAHVITGPDLARYCADWTTHYTAAPRSRCSPRLDQ